MNESRDRGIPPRGTKDARKRYILFSGSAEVRKRDPSDSRRCRRTSRRISDPLNVSGGWWIDRVGAVAHSFLMPRFGILKIVELFWPCSQSFSYFKFVVMRFNSSWLFLSQFCEVGEFVNGFRLSFWFPASRLCKIIKLNIRIFAANSITKDNS